MIYSFWKKEIRKFFPRGEDMTKLKLLPFDIDLDRIDILKQLNQANNSIAELKGIMNLLPNPNVILSLLAIGESKDSSAIENIITTLKIFIKRW